ncbi:hypothetical protein IU468_21095 [Nocardia farcinica]|nr:hypothetical protein [Nocardia farcinica]MBF6258803.1 hypothetical protein [Nocardia farcinica]
MTAILTATLSVIHCREQTLFNFHQSIALACQIDVLVDASGADIAMAEDRLDVAGMNVQALLGGGVAVAQPVQGDSWQVEPLADPHERSRQVV